MRLTTLFKQFFRSEQAGGIALFISTILSLLLANSLSGYIQFWNTDLGGHTLVQWINDGLMAIFFLLIGLELEREVYQGELSKVKEAILPVGAALGGVLFPALIYLFINYGTHYQKGIGIPMATDIAFSLGVLSLLGSRVPAALKIFLVALAVIDDLFAILAIAFFYTKNLDSYSLFIALAIFVLLLAFNRLRVRNLIPYLIGGAFMWYFMLKSGVHATISGVMLGFAIPFGNGDEKSTSYILQNFLHKPVAFFILPVFALANTAILLNGNLGDILAEKYSLGIALGLLIGKPVGITLFSYILVKLKWAKLGPGIRFKHIAGIGCLAGIGFTMSIFITMLAFDNESLINNAKLVIMLSSLVAGFSGYLILRRLLNFNQ